MRGMEKSRFDAVLVSLDAAVLDNDADPSHKVRMVLIEAKKAGMPWEQAWLNAMRSFSPPRTCGPGLRATMEVERSLIREVKPWFQAAYEDRDVSIDEFERASARAEKRLDSLMALV
jgi:hypothetical protein